MHRSSLRIGLVVLALASSLSACSSEPEGARDLPYAFLPATVFGPPVKSNVLFQQAMLSGLSGPFTLSTDPLNAHVAPGCTGTTTFSGSKMNVDWACSGTDRTWTVVGELTWDSKGYFGDCTTSYTSPTLSFSNLIVPFRAFKE